MDNKELEEKIAGIDLNSVYNTSPKALKELTNDYDEPLVRLLMMRAKTIGDQKGLLKYIKKAYGIWKKRTNFLWSEHPAVGGYPEYFDTMEANIDSDRYITTSGSVPVGSIEYYQLMSQQRESKSSDTYSKEMVDAAIAAVKAQIPHFEYDQQNEGLSIVYGGDKGKINLDEVIEKKTIDVVNKQLEEMTATDADIDEIFADVYGQDLVEQVNQEIAEEDEKNDEDEVEEDGEEESNEDIEGDVNIQDWDLFKDWIIKDKVIDAIKAIPIENVVGDVKRHFVIHKVLKEIGWLRYILSTRYVGLIKYYHVVDFKARSFQDDDLKPFKKNPTKSWGNHLTPGSNLGENYRSFAETVRNTFTRIIDGKLDDLKEFYVPGKRKYNQVVADNA